MGAGMPGSCEGTCLGGLGQLLLGAAAGGLLGGTEWGWHVGLGGAELWACGPMGRRGGGISPTVRRAALWLRRNATCVAFFGTYRGKHACDPPPLINQPVEIHMHKLNPTP